MSACFALRAFTLTTDPHKCAFGKWYDNYHTDDLVLAGLLKGFDKPHRAIHAIAERVEEAKQAGNFDAAAAHIETARAGALARLIKLFASTVAHMQSSAREIALVLEGSRKPFALAVDSVESTERLEEADVSDVPDIMAMADKGLMRGIAKRKKNSRMVLLLDVDMLFGDEDEAA